MSAKQHKLFLAGDALITQPWSHIGDPLFVKLIDEMRIADTTILNLETLVHEYRGYAQRDSGGAYMASPPEIADELNWAGVDMVSHANNHAFDYGSEGIIETHRNMTDAGIVIAGSGMDLQTARAPRYFSTGDTTVSLVSMTATYVPYGIASFARSDLHGRPGVNPLEVRRGPEFTVTPKQADWLYEIAGCLGRYSAMYRLSEFKIYGARFRVGDRNRIDIGARIRRSDFDGNLASIGQAVENADLTVVSIHSHQTGRWLRVFSHAALEAGADVVFIHGPHEMRGLELHRGKPVFYGMGDFVFQPDQIARLPAEAFETFRLSPAATVEEFHDGGRRIHLTRMRSVYEAYAATLKYTGGVLNGIRLLPVDLQFDSAYGTRGRPQRAGPELGKKIIAEVARLSSRFGTSIKYDRESNQGIVVCNGGVDSI